MLARACIECIIGYLGDGGLIDLWRVCDAVASPRPTAPLAASTPPSCSPCLKLLTHLSIVLVAIGPLLQWRLRSECLVFPTQEMRIR